jgi:hypothetical protein
LVFGDDRSTLRSDRSAKASSSGGDNSSTTTVRRKTRDCFCNMPSQLTLIALTAQGGQTSMHASDALLLCMGDWTIFCRTNVLAKGPLGLLARNKLPRSHIVGKQGGDDKLFVVSRS